MAGSAALGTGGPASRHGELGECLADRTAIRTALAWRRRRSLSGQAGRPRSRGVSTSRRATQRDLRLIARRTWRFFETFVTPADNMLPPDNFQEDPKPVVAHRTSPTNIGLYLLSAVAARDFGWAGTMETVERLEAAFDSMQKLPRFKGHFFNWYDTLDLRVLDPAYVSSVDSGNLAGHLIALANACEEWMTDPVASDVRRGMADDLRLAREAFDALPAAGRRTRRAPRVGHGGDRSPLERGAHDRGALAGAEAADGQGQEGSRRRAAR